jgi:hypothetical protein
MNRAVRAFGYVVLLQVCASCSKVGDAPASQPAVPTFPAPVRSSAETYEQRQVKLEARTAKIMQDLGITTELLAQFEYLLPVIAASVSEDATVQQKVRDALTPILGEAQMRPALIQRVAGGLTADHIDAVEQWAVLESTRRIVDALRAGPPAGAAPMKLSADRQKRISDMVRTTEAATAIISRLDALDKLGVAVADAVDPASSATFLRGSWSRFGHIDEEEIATLQYATALAEISDEEIDQFLQFSQSQAGAKLFAARAVSVSGILRQLTPKITSAIAAVAAKPLPAPADNMTAETLLAKAISLVHDDTSRRSLAEGMLLLRQADAAKPEDARILAELGFASVRMRGGPRPSDGEIRVASSAEHFAKAREYLERAARIDPNHADTHAYLGYIEFMLYNDAKAADQFKRARALGSTLGWLSLEEANLALASGLSDEAFAKYLTIVEAPSAGRSARSLAFGEAARLALTNGRWDEFTRIARKYLSEASTTDETRFGYARILLEQANDPDEAMATLNRIKPKWNARDVTKLSSIALALQASRGFDPSGGTSKKARGLLDRAIRAAGSHAYLVENLVYSRSGREIAEAVAQRGPKSTEVSNLLLEVAIRSNQHDMVERMLKAGADPNALDSSGNDPLIRSTMFRSNTRAFQMLLEYGADPEVHMRDGQTLRTILEGPPDPMRTEMLAILAKYQKPAK